MDEIQDVELQHTPRLRRRTAVYIDDMSELQQDQRVRNSAEVGLSTERSMHIFQAFPA